MPSVLPAVELLPRPIGGRIFSIDVKVRLGDVDRSGRLRLDATARFMQDAATDDAADAGLDKAYAWLVRRTKIVTASQARLGENLEVATWCTGLGRSWAERRTALIGDRGARIDAVSLWVQIDTVTGRPTRLADDFVSAYADTAAGRTISARLGLPAPSSHDTTPWHVRRTDLDPFGHVNNAATWSFLEEAAQLDLGARAGSAELEYLAPIAHDLEVRLVVAQPAATSDAWLLAGDSVVAAGRWTSAQQDPDAPSG